MTIIKRLEAPRIRAHYLSRQQRAERNLSQPHSHIRPSLSPPDITYYHTQSQVT
jgi:hypothetical protein